ncbi:MAG: phosphatase PAP2 family protein [Clostridia bacterium]|nr:phosphatase PAP2 family protein [Clostridia bacterium]
MAHWLDTVCYSFDHAILQAIHNFTVATNGFFNGPMRLVSLLGEEGIFLILLGLLLFCFKKTRRQGFCILAAIACGAVITNVLIKNIVARPRPFADAAGAFYDWWQYIGAPHASRNSFPSGHTTSAMAAMTAIFLTTDKKYSWTAFLFALLMGVSRMYLMVHYPTDVLGGLIAGALGAAGGYFLVRFLTSRIEGHPDAPLCRWYLTLDLAAVIGRIFHRTPATANSKNTESPETGCENNEDGQE